MAELPFPNLDEVKDQLKIWYNSGKYFKDITTALEPAKDYVDYVIGVENACVIFDIDETMVSEYSLMLANDFGWTKQVIEEAQLITDFPPLLPTLDFYNYCLSIGIKVIILSSRRQKHLATVTELLSNDKYYNYTQLILRPDNDEGKIDYYKLRMRKDLEDNQGLLIQCNIGDQYGDFFGGYANYDIKIPNKFYAIGLEK